MARLPWTFCSLSGFRLVRGVGALVTTARALVSFAVLQISTEGKYSDAAVTLDLFYFITQSPEKHCRPVVPRFYVG